MAKNDRRTRSLTKTLDVPEAPKLIYFNPTTGQNEHVDLGNLSIVNGAITTPGTGINEPSNGNKVDITVTDDGFTWQINPNAVTFAKMQEIDAYTFVGNSSSGTTEPMKINSTAYFMSLVNVSDEGSLKAAINAEAGVDFQAYDAGLQSLASLPTAANRIAYSTAINVWDETELSAFVRGILDDADAATLRSSIGLGTLATQNGTFSDAALNATTITISGTANRITSSAGAQNLSANRTWTVDISGSYVGQTSITTLGTITTGTWNGSDIALSYITPASADSKILGRRSGSSGDWEEITLGTNLSMSGTTLNAAGGGGSGSGISIGLSYALSIGGFTN